MYLVHIYARALSPTTRCCVYSSGGWPLFLTRQLPALSRIFTKCALHDITDTPEHPTTPQQGWGVNIR
jgi:hypothetical protein